MPETPTPVETCDQCMFDSQLYNRADTISSQTITPALLQAATEGLDADMVNRRPDAQTWSMAEYVDHVREMTFGNRFAIEVALNDPGVDLGDPPPSSFSPDTRELDVEAAFAGLEDEASALRELLAGLDDEHWHTAATLGGDVLTVGWFARHVLHDGLHHLADIGRIRHGFGLGAPSQTGQLVQINVSNGGVPKLPVSSAVISPAGVRGDSQNDRRHHGRPVQAVCLWSADVIAELAAEGHPIAAGNAGENLTVEGIDWTTLRPGARIRVGDVSMLVSAHAIPCAKNAQWFADRDYNRMLHDDNPGFSRLYAMPLGTGTVAVGDQIMVEPAL